MWKQPITTECNQFDLITRIVFVEIMLSARNTDMESPEELWNGNKRFWHQLKKGQCVFAIDKFCKQSGISKNRVSQTLQLLTSGKLQIKLQISRKSYGMEVTIENYDDLVDMKINSQIKSKSNRNQSQINSKSYIDKSVESVESVEIVKKYNTLPSFLEKLTEEFPTVDVEREYVKAMDWVKSMGKAYKDYEAFMRNWCRRCVENGTGLRKIITTGARFVPPPEKSERVGSVKTFREIMAGKVLTPKPEPV